MIGLGITKTPNQQMRATTSMFGMMQKLSVKLQKTLSTSSFDDLGGMTIVVFCEQRGGNVFGGSFQLQEFLGMVGSDGGAATGLALNTSGSYTWNTSKQLNVSVHDGNTARSSFSKTTQYARWSSSISSARNGTNKYCVFARFDGSESSEEVTHGFLSPLEVSVGTNNVSITGDQDLGVINGGTASIGGGSAPEYNATDVKILKVSVWKSALTDGKILALTGQSGSSLSDVTRANMSNYRMRSRFESYSDIGTGDPACEWNFTKAGDNSGHNVQLYPGPLGFTDATCDTTSGDATVTCDASAKIKVNQGVYGTGIPLGATVSSVNTPGAVTSFELSANATASNSNTTLTFGEVVLDSMTASDRIDLISNGVAPVANADNK